MNKYQITSMLFLLCALFISLLLGQITFVKNMAEGFETLTPEEIKTSIQLVILDPTLLDQSTATDTLVSNPTIMDDPNIASLIVKNPTLMANTTIANYPSILTAQNGSIFGGSSTTTPVTTPTTPVPSNYNISSECYTYITELQNPNISTADLQTATSNVQLACNPTPNMSSITTP